MTRKKNGKDVVRAAIDKIRNNGVLSVSAISPDVAARYVDSLCAAGKSAMPADFDSAGFLRAYSTEKVPCLTLFVSGVSGEVPSEAVPALKKYSEKNGGRENLLRDPLEDGASVRQELQAGLFGSALHSKALLKSLEHLDSVRNGDGTVDAEYYNSWFQDMYELTGRMNARLYADGSSIPEAEAGLIMTGLKNVRNALLAVEQDKDSIFTKGCTCGVVLGMTKEDSITSSPTVSVSVSHISGTGDKVERINIFRPEPDGMMSVCRYETSGREDFPLENIREDSVEIRSLGESLSSLELFPSGFAGLPKIGREMAADVRIPVLSSSEAAPAETERDSGTGSVFFDGM